MQTPYRQTYVETYRVPSPCDCTDVLYVTITRERGGKIDTVSVSHAANDQLTNRQTDTNNNR